MIPRSNPRAAFLTQHQVINHLTGTTSMLAEALADLDGSASLHFAATTGSFVADAVLSGFLDTRSPEASGRR